MEDIDEDIDIMKYQRRLFSELRYGVSNLALHIRDILEELQLKYPIDELQQQLETEYVKQQMKLNDLRNQINGMEDELEAFYKRDQ